MITAAVQHSTTFGSTILSGVVAGVLTMIVGAFVLRGLGLLIGWPRKVERRLAELGEATEAQNATLAEHTEILTRLDHEIHPNGGDSQADKINAIYVKLVGPLPKSKGE